MSDGSSSWERGEDDEFNKTLTELDRPFQETVPEAEIVDWSAMVYVLIEERGYDGRSIVCVFDNEGEANSYAGVRNQFAEHGIVYEVDPWPIGRPGCDETEPHFDGPIWEIRWDLQYNADRDVASIAKQRWHSGEMPPAAGFRYSPTDRGFTVWGIDRDAVIQQAKPEAAKRVSAEIERLRIAAEKKAEHSRFRIDSEHEFG